MKKILSLMALAIVMLSSCNNDDEKTLTCNFSGMLTEADTEYITTKDNGTVVIEDTEYTSTFTDKSKTFVYPNYSADWNKIGTFTLAGGFTYTNKTDIKTANSIAAIAGKGVKGDTYITAYVDGMNENSVTFINKASYTVKSAYFTNSTIAVISMLNGDSFAKKFTKEDWFKLTVTGKLADKETGKVDFYLAKDGTVNDSWTLVDLATLGEVDKLVFTLSSSDSSEYEGVTYMNTPAYFCMDGLTILL